MKRIIYFKHFDGGSEFYRLKPLCYINNKDLTLVMSTEPNITWDLIDSFDVIFILRPSGEAGLNLIKLAKSMHKKVIIDFDDAINLLDQYNPLYTYFQHEMRSIIECITLSDEVWVSTAAIRDAFRLYNKNIHIISNAHDDHAFPVRMKRPFTYNKIATYRGGESHYGDMYDLGVPEKVIEMVNGNRDWSFTFFGQRFHYLEKRCGDNYIAYPGGWEFVEFQKKMQEQNACVAFYPLATTAFNKSKSNIFWIEMTYAGSAVFGNKELPEYDKIPIGRFGKMMLEFDEPTLKTMNRLSWELICDEYLLSKVNKVREERLLAI